MSKRNSYGAISLLTGVGKDIFFKDTWDKACRLYSQTLHGKTEEILNLENLEFILSTLNHPENGWLHLAQGGLNKIPNYMVDDDGMLKMGKIRAAYLSGETLYLTKVERLSSSIMNLCRKLEMDLIHSGIYSRKPLNAHVFLTPPNSQGFPVHRDEHASFVLQLEGVKEWTIYAPKSGLDNDNGDEIHRIGPVDKKTIKGLEVHEFCLKAGDVLYVPEWWLHEAKALNSYSLHVTLRIFPLRLSDLLSELFEAMPILSRSLPLKLTKSSTEIVDYLSAILKSGKFTESLTKQLEQTLWKYKVPNIMLPQDHLRQVLMIDQLQSNTLMERPVETACTIFEIDEDIGIGFPGGVIRGPKLIKTVFEFVANHFLFSPKDLPDINGTSYDKLSIAKTMLKDGLLRISEQPHESFVTKIADMQHE